LLTLCRPRQTAAIEELDSSDCSSDGTVDEVIERSSYQVTEAASSSYGFDASLFTVAARLLKSPGVQREIVTAALSDPEVFDILAGKMDLVRPAPATKQLCSWCSLKLSCSSTLMASTRCQFSKPCTDDVVRNVIILDSAMD
jgi:hypothetical protein